MNKHQDKYKICLDLSPDLMEKWKKCIQKYPLSGCQSHINSNKCTKFFKKWKQCTQILKTKSY